MEQTKALNALAPFLALTKSASSPRAAADLISRATSAPNTFVFAELLSTPQIQALSSNEEYASHLTLLKIFSYGTYQDYTSTADLPSLNEAQTLKLRQLSLMTIAKSPRDLTYSNLQKELGIHNTRDLEDLVISAIYAGLIDAKLDPHNQLVNASSVAPLRDLPPNSIPAMLNTLNEWSTRCVTTLADLESQIAGIKAEALKRHKEEKEWAAHVEKLMESTIKEDEKSSVNTSHGVPGGKGSLFSTLGRRLGGGSSSSSAKRSGGDMDEDLEDMDMDEEDDEPADARKSSRAPKKRGLGGLSFGSK